MDEAWAVAGLRTWFCGVFDADRESARPPCDGRDWTSPYTNVMLVDLNWARRDATLRAMRASGGRGLADGVYGCRWGDLPLWGSALARLELCVDVLDADYDHGSHSERVEAYGTSRARDVP